MEDFRIIKCALLIAIQWQKFIDEAGGDTWRWNGERQGLRDALQCMVMSGCIQDFSVNPPSIKYKGLVYQQDWLNKRTHYQKDIK